MPQFNKCDLSFVCRKTWETLPETGNAYVRYCGECEKGVFPVRTRRQLEAASSVGRCVALTNENEIVGWIGQSDADYDWMAEQSEVVAIRARHPLDDEAKRQLQLAFPRVGCVQDRCLTGDWIEIGTFSAQIAAVLEGDIRAHFPEFDIRERHVS